MVDHWLIVEGLLQRLIADDRDPAVQDHAQAIRNLSLGGHRTPEDVLRELDNLYNSQVSDLEDELSAATTDLAKYVTVQRFINFYASEEVSLLYLSRSLPEAYMQDLPDDGREGVLYEDLPRDPNALLLPSRHSWLTPRIYDGWSGRSICDALRLGTASPPLIGLIFPHEYLSRDQVKVRSPHAIDIVPGRDTNWVRGAVPDECIDNDIYRRTCGRASCHE